jgi:hypothetical protein
MEENKKVYTENKDSRKGLYSFSQSSTKRFIANHLDKLVWACILFLVVFTIVKVGNLSLYGIIFLIFLCTISYFFGKIQQKFAYKIIVDFNSRMVRLYMHRNEAIIAVDFDDIKSIRVNGYIIFTLKERKVFYNDLQDSNLLKCLNKIKKIDWGPLCGLWGPNKNLRNALSGNMKNGH